MICKNLDYKDINLIHEIIDSVMSIEKEHSFVPKVKEKNADHKGVVLSFIELAKVDKSKNNFKKNLSTHSLANKSS